MIKDFDELYSKLTQHIDDKNRDTVDLLRQEIRASKKETVDEITEFIDNNIVPQLSEHDEKLKDHDTGILNLQDKALV